LYAQKHQFKNGLTIDFGPSKGLCVLVQDSSEKLSTNKKFRETNQKLVVLLIILALYWQLNRQASN